MAVSISIETRHSRLNQGCVFSLSLSRAYSKQMPETGKLVASKLGYYIRPGKHSMTKQDWNVFLDFADQQFR